MKQVAACLLVAVGIGGAGYSADKALVSLVPWFLGINVDMPDLTTDFMPDWHFKEPHLPKLCFGFCPEMEN